MEKFGKIIENIKNLMDLANNNPNENEALAAALKAQQLMAKYNVHMENLERDEPEERITKKVFDGSNYTGNRKWRPILARVIAQNFRCKYYLSLDCIVFYGYENDAEIALNVFKMLISVGTKLSQKEYYERKKNGLSTKGVMNAFLLGFCDGVKEVLDKQCTALMIVTPKKVEEDFQAMISGDGWRTKITKISSNHDGEIRNRGRIAGREAISSRNIAMA